MKRIFFPCLLLLIVALVSCEKDLLDKKPLTSFSEKDIWSDPNLIEAFINSKYTGIGWGFREILWSSLSDESMFKHDYGTHLINRGELRPDNLGVANFWDVSYRYIKDCNLFFEKIGNVKMDDNLKNRFIGEMKFIRAFHYFDLFRNYGGVPLILRTFKLNDDFTSVKRNTIDECADFLVKELDSAALLLKESYTGKDFGRATKWACLALKARILLYAASPLYNPSGDKTKWQKAADAAKAIIDANKFSLYPDYQKLFLVPNNQEVIFDRAYINKNASFYLELYNGPNGYGGWAGNMPLQNLVDQYETADGKMISDPTSGYDPQNPYVNRDPRFYQTILYNGAQYRDRKVETFLPGGKDTKDGLEPWNTSLTGYYLRKFIDENIPVKSATNNGTQHWIYFRFGEVLLNYAEAINEVEGPAKALQPLNMIRARAGMPPLPPTLSQDEMRQRIRHERQIELSFEEHRFYDVRRWMIAMDTDNKPAGGVQITKNPNGSLTFSYVTVQPRKFLKQHYWLPIPLREVQADPNLQQNPNY